MRPVAYLYNQAITNYHFSKEHPMKTKRIRMAHSLIESYGLNDHLTIYHSKQATKDELVSFHEPSYVEFLENWVTGRRSDLVASYNDDSRKKARENAQFQTLYKVNHGYDCPGFEGLFNFCQLAAGGSIDAADLIVSGLATTVVNWAGGYHHAKKTEASGFCYVNDIVLCIIELLKSYPRVLYLDIDVHHGDGVEEAFNLTNRVMTVSFHEFDQDFFPGTGSIDSVGEGIGKYFAVNVPLKKGITDQVYLRLFKKVMDEVIERYRPDVCVIQCGADSLSRDRLGHLNLSIKGHAACLSHMLNYNLPCVFLGGGGYTIENVSRCWAYETGVLAGVELPNQIPMTDPFYQLYQQNNHRLHFPIEERPNENTQAYLDEVFIKICENLRSSVNRPSVGFHYVPKRNTAAEEYDWRMIQDDEDSFEDELCQEAMTINQKPSHKDWGHR